MFNWYVKVLKKYATFRGRASRSEFWWFTLAQIIMVFLIAMGDAIFWGVDPYTGEPIMFFTGLYMLGTLLPNIAVSVRRLHDINRSGWWYLLILVPIASLVLLVFFCLESDERGARFDGETNPSDDAETFGAQKTAKSSNDAIDLLRKLGELKDSGLLSEEEFEAKKAEILKKI